jgi:excisionase family DNA binding protein
VSTDREPYRYGRPLTRADVLTADEVADLLGVARSTVMGWAKAGTIPSRRFGRARRFIRQEIEAWMLDPNRRAA